MNGGLKTSLDLDEGPVFVHVIQHAPNQGVIAQVKDKPVRIPEHSLNPVNNTREKLPVGGHRDTHMYTKMALLPITEKKNVNQFNFSTSVSR